MAIDLGLPGIGGNDLIKKKTELTTPNIDFTQNPIGDGTSINPTGRDYGSGPTVPGGEWDPSNPKFIGEKPSSGIDAIDRFNDTNWGTKHDGTDGTTPVTKQDDTITQTVTPPIPTFDNVFEIDSEPNVTQTSNVFDPPPAEPIELPEEQQNVVSQSSTIFDDPAVDPNAGDPSMELENQGYETEAGDIFSDYNIEGARTGVFADVENERAKLDKEADQFEYYVMQNARNQASQAGLQPGTAGYNRMMSNAMSQANDRRLGIEQTLSGMQGRYRQDAMGNLRNIELDALTKSVGERNWDWTRHDIDFYNSERDRIETKQDAQNYINSVQSPKLKSNLQRALSEGGVEGMKALADRSVDEWGVVNDKAGEQDPIQDARDAVNNYVDGLTMSPNGDEWEEGEQAKYKAQMLDARVQQLFGLTTEQLEETEGKADVTAKLKEIEAGTMNISELKTSDWNSMTDEQIEDFVTQDLNKGMTYLRTRDFANSGLEADYTYETEVGGSMDDTKLGAGEGEGSVVMYNGKPYRITRYVSKLFTSGDNKRAGRIYGVPLSGANAGIEEPLTDSGKIETDK